LGFVVNVVFLWFCCGFVVVGQPAGMSGEEADGRSFVVFLRVSRVVIVTLVVMSWGFRAAAL
jgi:hypothetical protein